jgi:hypothetical protein
MQIFNRFERKIMTATDTPSDLDCNNLSIGTYYELTLCPYVSSTTSAYLSATHNGSIIAEALYSNAGAVSCIETLCVSKIFKATSTSIIFSSLNAIGDGTVSATYILLQERNDLKD